MFIRYVIAACLLCATGGVLIGHMYNTTGTKPLWVNQEIRERVFLECSRAVSGVDCGEQAKQLATVGNVSGEVLFRPRKNVG